MAVDPIPTNQIVDGILEGIERTRQDLRSGTVASPGLSQSAAVLPPLSEPLRKVKAECLDDWAQAEVAARNLGVARARVARNGENTVVGWLNSLWTSRIQHNPRVNVDHAVEQRDAAIERIQRTIAHNIARGGTLDLPTGINLILNYTAELALYFDEVSAVSRSLETAKASSQVR